MGQTPDHIREDIEQTRGRMGETVEAIGYKTDVKARVKDSVAEKKDAVVSGASTVVNVSKENPLGLGLAGLAAGFVVGTLLPSTRAEDERLGEMSDELGGKAREAGQEVLDRTKGAAQEEMTSSLRDKAQEVGSGSNPS
jgi:hypothetical protein